MDNDNVSYMYGDPYETNKSSTSKYVSVLKTEYEELLERSAWLSALEEAGVNSWEGFDTAIDIYDEENEDVE